MAIDIAWARAELTEFLKLTELRRPPSSPGIVEISSRMVNASSKEQIVAKAHVVEQVLNRVLPRWRADISDSVNRVNRWNKHREAAVDALERVATIIGHNTESGLIGLGCFGREDRLKQLGLAHIAPADLVLCLGIDLARSGRDCFAEVAALP